ncbi:MAG: LPS assembly lipoprotein LptE [Gammaproteobacteria bacterium]|nr:LPS assembly lipoprotein LptE [Gammaproteobacteria bacterium]
MKLVTWALLFSLAGCGFHLRTSDIGTSLESARVEASKRNLLTQPLRRALSRSGVNEADTGESQIVVKLLDQRKVRRSVSVTGRGRAAEYETTLQVRYQVRDADGVELIAPRWVRSERVIRVDRNVVGNSEELELLEQEMQNDLVQQILRALNAVTRTTVDAG